MALTMDSLSTRPEDITDAELRHLWVSSNAERPVRTADNEAGWDWETMERKTCYQMMRKYLAILTAPYLTHDLPSGFLEFRALDLSGKRSPVRYWLNLAQYAEPGREPHVTRALYRWADTCNRDGRDIFVGVLPRAAQSGKANAVPRAGFFWADLDFKVGAASGSQVGEAAVWKAVAAYPETPDLLVLTGGGVHVYYRLGKVVDFADVPQARFCEKLRAWQQGLLPGCDPVQDAPHILRLPGFRNRKPGRAGALVRLSPTLPETETLLRARPLQS